MRGRAGAEAATWRRPHGSPTLSRPGSRRSLAPSAPSSAGGPSPSPGRPCGLRRVRARAVRTAAWVRMWGRGRSPSRLPAPQHFPGAAGPGGPVPGRSEAERCPWRPLRVPGPCERAGLTEAPGRAPRARPPPPGGRETWAGRGRGARLDSSGPGQRRQGGVEEGVTASFTCGGFALSPRAPADRGKVRAANLLEGGIPRTAAHRGPGPAPLCFHFETWLYL